MGGREELAAELLGQIAVGGIPELSVVYPCEYVCIFIFNFLGGDDGNERE